MTRQKEKNQNNNKASGKPVKIVVLTENETDMSEAETMAEKLDIAITREISTEENNDLMLCFDEKGLALIGNGQTLRGDFTRMLPRIKQDNLNRELLVKATKLKGVEGTPILVDATAGLGEDSFLLAAAGFFVQLYEYDPVIAALLRNALCRAAKDPKLSDIVGRMQLFESDSLVELPQLTTPPDVVLLDPMFPARQKSALIKKKFQLLQQLECPCPDETALMQAALVSHPRKIVIKRPLKGAFLAERKPDYSLKGKAIRYDCIVFPGNEKRPMS